MDGLFSFLLFAGFFFLMMRFGCGSHIAHGHGGHKHESRRMVKAVDPVCGKSLGDEEGYGKMHRSVLYRFCSQACLQTFENNPQKFMVNSAAALENNGGDKK